MSVPNAQEEQLDQLLQWLEQDPDNPSLCHDTASAAIEANNLEKAAEIIAKFSASNEATAQLRNLQGVIAIRRGKFSQSTEIFQDLLNDGNDSNAVKFNLAWSFALANQRDEALDLISDEMATTIPQAAALKVQMLHGKGLFEEAMKEAKQLKDIHPDDPGFMAALSVLAIDLEDTNLARECAEKATTHPDALTSLGTLNLGDHQNELAKQQFARALEINPDNPRAWVGQGLVSLNQGDHESALSSLDKGAELFGDHLGSWIAAGWAYFIKGDRAVSRERFEKALSLDDNFAENHGSLAVLDVIEGELESAEKRCEIAMRLDRECFSAALANSLILEAQGDSEKAERIVEIAMQTPIDASGRTLSDNLIMMNGGIRGRRLDLI